MKLEVPGRGSLELTHLLLDLNGTLATDGELIDGVAQRIALLRERLTPAIVTADTHGRASLTAEVLGIKTLILPSGDEAAAKLSILLECGAENTVSIGNGANDALMLERSAIGICVIGSEGASSAALLAADVVVTDIRDALDLLLKPHRLVATLRT
jgi:soluble P-type ATPase